MFYVASHASCSSFTSSLSRLFAHFSDPELRRRTDPQTHSAAMRRMDGQTDGREGGMSSFMQSLQDASVVGAARRRGPHVVVSSVMVKNYNWNANT